MFGVDFASHTQIQPDEILVNKYGYVGAAAALRVLALPEDHYVANVTHALSSRRNETGNMQLFLTGTIRCGEKELDACTREVQEEIGMRPCVLRPLHREETKTRDVQWYSCRLRDLIELQEPMPTCHFEKNTNHKIACVLHGTQLDVFHFLTRLPCFSNEDGIAGVLCLSVREMKRLLEIADEYDIQTRFSFSSLQHREIFSGNKAPEWMLQNEEREGERGLMSKRRRSETFQSLQLPTSCGIRH